MAVASPPVRVEHHGAVAEIVLNDQDRGNVIDHAWTDAFVDAVDAIGVDDRCVLVRAEGANFCFGGDVAGFGAADDPGAHIRSLADRLHQGLRLLAASEVPVVAAVQGWATGAGMSLALAADILVVGASARFKTAYNGLGFTADGGMTWHLSRRVPPAIATDLLLSDRVLGADEARQLGLVSRVVADAELTSAARDLAGAIAGRSVTANRAVKRLLREAPLAPLDTHLDAEAQAIETAADGPDGREGVAAFLARRPPSFG